MDDPGLLAILLVVATTSKRVRKRWRRVDVTPEREIVQELTGLGTADCLNGHGGNRSQLRGERGVLGK